MSVRLMTAVFDHHMPDLCAQDALMERNEAPKWVQETKQMEMAL